MLGSSNSGKTLLGCIVIKMHIQCCRWKGSDIHVSYLTTLADMYSTCLGFPHTWCVIPFLTTLHTEPFFWKSVDAVYIYHLLFGVFTTLFIGLSGKSVVFRLLKLVVTASEVGGWLGTFLGFFTLLSGSDRMMHVQAKMWVCYCDWHFQPPNSSAVPIWDSGSGCDRFGRDKKITCMTLFSWPLDLPGWLQKCYHFKCLIVCAHTYIHVHVVYRSMHTWSLQVCIAFVILVAASTVAKFYRWWVAVEISLKLSSYRCYS